MIVRILSEGQLEVPESYLSELNALDVQLADAVSEGDQTSFERCLAELLDRVRAVGTPIADEVLAPSDVVLPGPDSTVTMVAALLSDEGLIPG